MNGDSAMQDVTGVEAEPPTTVSLSTSRRIVKLTEETVNRIAAGEVGAILRHDDA